MYRRRRCRCCSARRCGRCPAVHTAQTWYGAPDTHSDRCTDLDPDPPPALAPAQALTLPTSARIRYSTLTSDPKPDKRPNDSRETFAYPVLFTLSSPSQRVSLRSQAPMGKVFGSKAAPIQPDLQPCHLVMAWTLLLTDSGSSVQSEKVKDTQRQVEVLLADFGCAAMDTFTPLEIARGYVVAHPHMFDVIQTGGYISASY